MDFELSEEQRMVRDMTREFAEKELLPRASKHDREARIDREVFAQLSELGLWGLTVPEEYGGTGLGNLALALVLEEINWACASTGITVSVHNSLGCSPIVKYGTEEQKKTWLPRLASGELIGAYALTEPDCGSDAAAISTRAVADGDDFVLNGTKVWVTTGLDAGMVITYARTNPEVPKGKGITAFIVPIDAPGFRIGKRELKCGIRGSTAVELLYEDMRLPRESVLGEVDRGFPIALETLDGGRIGVASQAIGIGRACLDAAIKYSKEREQFNQPIGNFQAVQWKLADMASRIDSARLLVQQAAWKRDRGLPCTREAAEAKLLASTACNFAADECLQIHGGAGYTDDFHVERLFRDARITEIYEGATDIQRLVIARHLLA